MQHFSRYSFCSVKLKSFLFELSKPKGPVKFTLRNVKQMVVPGPNFIKMYYTKKKKRAAANRQVTPGATSKLSAKKKDISKDLDALMNVKEERAIVEASPYVPVNAIETLPLHPQILANISKRKFTKLTEIQDKCVMPILEGENLMGIAQTGTGKTAAFLMPIIHNLIGKKANGQVSIIVPTRELAVQVNEEFISLAVGTGLSSICLIGGTSVNKNISDLKRPYHLVIGTPGRLKDLRNSRMLDFSKVQISVLDEFDRLLDMGFQKDILDLVGSMNNRRQTILLSATEEAGQKQIIAQLLKNPVNVRVSNGVTSSASVEQEAIRLKEGQDKFVVLTELLRRKDFDKVLVFIETKHNVKKIWKKLMANGINALQIHGNVAQNKRLSAIQEFKEGKVKVLLATDIAARGLDISDVTHVVNYEVPRTKDSYIHRVGRTGRAGKTGKAYTLISHGA